jgi:hypothetical protein
VPSGSALPWQAAEKVVSGPESRPQRLKPDSKQSGYRSGKPLRHPKSGATPSFSAACWARKGRVLTHNDQHAYDQAYL